MKKVMLAPLQKEVLSFFARHLFGAHFYWTGGTLLASQYLHHRQSFDLDLFSEDLYADLEYISFIRDLKKAFGIKKVTETLQHNRRTYFLYHQKEVLKLELVYFPFLALKKRKKLPQVGVATDSLTDIMVNKILATYQRQEAKDVYDVYYYLTHKSSFNLFQLIAQVEKKFGIAIEPALWLAKAQELTQLLKHIAPIIVRPSKNLQNEVEGFFQDLFNLYAKKRIK